MKLWWREKVYDEIYIVQKKLPNGPFTLNYYSINYSNI